MTWPLPSSAVVHHRRVAYRLYEKVINYPFYVPDLGQPTNGLFLAGRVEEYIADIRRQAALGSNAAASLLAYLYLTGAINGKVDLDAAASMCRDPARSGHAYAQFVMAWVCCAYGEVAEAVHWLRKSAIEGLFAPAYLDLGRFVVAGIGVEEPDRAAGLKILWEAHRCGHRIALLASARALLAAGSGLGSKLLGLLMMPVAVIRAALYVRRYPLSEFGFSHEPTRPLPLLKRSSPAD